MQRDDFLNLPDHEKKEMLVDAEEVVELEDDIARYEVFRIDNFFVEVSLSVIHRFRKILNIYTLKDITVEYAGQVYSSFHN